MFGLVFSKWRDEEQPWWDDDPETRARNLSTELALSRHMTNVLNINGGDDPEPGGKGSGVPPILAVLFKYLSIPALFVWLVWLGVTEFRADLKASREDTRAVVRMVEMHMLETRGSNERMERMQEISLAVMEAVCINLAVGRDEQQRCLQPRRAGIP